MLRMVKVSQPQAMGKPSRFQMSWRQKQRDPAAALVSMLDPGTVPKLSSHTEVLSMSCPWGVHITGRGAGTEQVGLQRRQRCRNQPMGSRYTDMSVCLFPSAQTSPGKPHQVSGNSGGFLSLVRLWCHSSMRSPHDESRGRPCSSSRCSLRGTAHSRSLTPPWPLGRSIPALPHIFFFIDMKTFSLKLPSLGLTKTIRQDSFDSF